MKSPLKVGKELRNERVILENFFVSIRKVFYLWTLTKKIFIFIFISSLDTPLDSSNVLIYSK